MILDTLVASSIKRSEAAMAKKSTDELIYEIEKSGKRRNHVFYNALKNGDDVSVIAEIKKASPSKGLIRQDFDHMKIAEEYSKANIQALSVLTEPEYFKGDINYIKDIKARYDIPVLRKDFIVNEYMIYEARLYGADAVLLIMAALDDDKFAHLYDLAKSLDLDVLVEVHNAEELKRASGKAEIIGVNNRNLATFDEDITTCEKLLPLIPNGALKVAESAIRSHKDFEYLRGLGYDAALIGEAFMRREDIVKAVRDLRYGE